MRRIIIIFVAAILGIVVPDGTRSQDVPPAPPSEYDKELVKQIQKGDNDAIEKAGKSGNRIFVPYLRQEKDKLQQPRLQPQKEKERLQQGYPVRPINPAALALARLGETQELQEVWCKAITDEPKRGLVPSVNELEQVGGWFAIEGLQALLTPEGLIHWHKPTRQEKNSDTSDLPVEVRAMFALSKMVPNSPVPPTPIEQLRAQTQAPEHIKLWQDWIAAHKDDLSKLQPIGEGVDFSANACKNGKPVKKR